MKGILKIRTGCAVDAGFVLVPATVWVLWNASSWAWVAIGISMIAALGVLTFLSPLITVEFDAKPRPSSNFVAYFEDDEEGEGGEHDPA